MTPGLNIKIRVWRVSNQPDDAIGGALLSGTILHDYVPARLDPIKPEMVLLQQGYEIDSVFNCMTHRLNPMVKEKDEIEVIFPDYHPFYHELLQIRGIQFSSLNPYDSRDFILMTVKRKNYAHTTTEIV